MGRPTSRKDWGWCRDTCNKDPGLAEKLQETKLDILHPDECEDFDPVMQPNATHEICTGRKNTFPTVWLFKRTKSLETGRFSFKHIGKEKNYLGFKKSKHDFYLNRGYIFILFPLLYWFRLLLPLQTSSSFLSLDVCFRKMKTKQTNITSPRIKRW